MSYLYRLLVCPREEIDAVIGLSVVEDPLRKVDDFRRYGLDLPPAFGKDVIGKRSKTSPHEL